MAPLTCSGPSAHDSHCCRVFFLNGSAVLEDKKVFLCSLFIEVAKDQTEHSLILFFPEANSQLITGVGEVQNLHLHTFLLCFLLWRELKKQLRPGHSRAHDHLSKSFCPFASTLQII